MAYVWFCQMMSVETRAGSCQAPTANLGKPGDEGSLTCDDYRTLKFPENFAISRASLKAIQKNTAIKSVLRNFATMITTTSNIRRSFVVTIPDDVGNKVSAFTRIFSFLESIVVHLWVNSVSRFAFLLLCTQMFVYFQSAYVHTSSPSHYFVLWQFFWPWQRRCLLTFYRLLRFSSFSLNSMYINK